MNTLSLKNTIIGLVAVFMPLIVVFLLLSNAHTASAEAPGGLNAQVSTSSSIVVGPQSNVYLFGTTTRETSFQCAGRVISTTGQPIMLSFAAMSSTSLSQTIGFQQAASTTVAYNGGIYGCGYMMARGLNASTTITIMETH